MAFGFEPVRRSAVFLLETTTHRYRSALLPGVAVSVLLLSLIAAVLWFIAGFRVGSESWFASLSVRDWSVLQITTLQAAASAILSVFVGTLLAWALYHRSAFFGRSILIALLSSALVLPALIVVLGIVSVLGRSGWLNQVLGTVFDYQLPSFLFGLSGILIAHVYLNGSFAVRSLLNRLELIPAEKRKLAASLGLSPWQRFRIVEWPAIQSTIPGLAATIFLLCFTSFAIVLTLGGSPRYNTLEVAIYEALKLDFDVARSLDLALLQLIICGFLVVAASSLTSSTSGTSSTRNRIRLFERPGAALLQWVILLAGSICFIAPLAAMVVDGLLADLPKIIAEPRFKQALVTSLSIALVSSMLSTVMALFLANAGRTLRLQSRLAQRPYAALLSRLISFSGTLYLAVPSLVLGLGFFLIARQLPGSLNQWAAVAVIAANVLITLPFAIAVLAPALEKTAVKYDRLTNSLGLGLFMRWRIAEWPLLKSDIAYVAAIGFCFSMGDLGVIALFGSQDFATLPWYLFQKMGSYQTQDAAGIALIMLMIVWAVFLLLPRLFGASKQWTARNA